MRELYRLDRALAVGRDLRYVRRRHGQYAATGEAAQ